MKPLLLELENIGPFVKRTMIDFSMFGDNSLFLITGKTGSGKSFIFDSMCYSLFGETPSGRENNLASDFKRVGDKPRILFRFSIGGDVYEVERALPYEEGKKRGSGTTMRGETQTLKRISPKTEVLSTKKNDVREKCEELLQLKMDQFSRVIMIPQGEFRELLKAGTEDREKLLRQLFRSYSYLDIARELENEFKARYSRFLKLKEETGIVLDQLSKRLPPEDVPPDCEIGIATINKHRDKIASSIPRIKEEAGGLASDYEEARKVSAWMDGVIRMERSRAELRSDLEVLDTSGKDEIASFRERVRRHDLSNEFVPLLEKINGKTTLIDRMEGQLLRSTAEMETRKNALVALEVEKATLPVLRSRYNEILTNQGTILELRSTIQDQKKMKRTMNDLLKKEKALVLKQADITTRSEGIGSNLDRIQKEIKGRSVQITDIEVAMDRHNIVKDLIQVYKDRTSQLPILMQMQQKIDEKTDGISEAYGILKEKRVSREGSLAFELSASLSEGQPCPVCGSLSHPTPASSPNSIVTKESVEAAEAAHRKLMEDLDSLSKAHSSAQTRVQGYDERIGQMISAHPDLMNFEIPSLEKEKENLSASIRSEKKRTSDLERLQKDYLELSGRQKAILDERSIVLAEAEGIKTEISLFASQLSRSEEQIKKNSDIISTLVPEKDDIASKILVLEDEKGNLPARIEKIEVGFKQASDAVLELGTRIGQIGSELGSAREGLASYLSEFDSLLKYPKYSCFGSRKDVEGGIIDRSEITMIKDKIERFDSDLSKIKGKIEQTEKELTESLCGKPLPNYEDRDRQSLDETSKKAKLDEANKGLSFLEHEVNEIETSLKRIEKVALEMAEMEPELAILRELSEQVKGNGRPKISLERFFLAQRFEEVLIEANTRLKKLSEGRFDLKREDETVTGGGAKTGLNIIVCDNITGTERPANTLSGGQMFLTSLALALGLADVVQARSGGIRMDALFIDEGFGSLDDETLQIALKVLSELRRGRMVGVISHVQELKRQIPQRIEVTAGREGSTLEIVA